jgi:hypothetical protein
MKTVKTYSKAAAAREMGVTRQTVINWIAAGVVHVTDEGRIAASELERMSRVPLPQGFQRTRSRVTFTSSGGTQCQIAIHRGKITITTIGDDRIALDRAEAADFSRVLSAYAVTGKFPPNDE